MKKNVKIILSCLLGLVVLGGIGLVIGLNKGNNKLSGTVNEEWRKNETHIDGLITDKEKYYSANEDYIYNIHWDSEYIEWDTHFNSSDDLEVYFVFTNVNNKTYTTPVERVHISTGDYMKTDLPSDFIAYPIYISEVWVRTED